MASNFRNLSGYKGLEEREEEQKRLNSERQRQAIMRTLSGAPQGNGMLNVPATPAGMLGNAPGPMTDVDRTLQQARLSEAKRANTPPQMLGAPMLRDNAQGPDQSARMFTTSPQILDPNSNSPTARAYAAMQQQQHAPRGANPISPADAPKRKRDPANLFALALGGAASIATANPMPLLMAAGAVGASNKRENDKLTTEGLMTEYAQRETRGEYDPQSAMAYNPILGRAVPVKERPTADRTADLAAISPRMAFDTAMTQHPSLKAPYKAQSGVGKVYADMQNGLPGSIGQSRLGALTEGEFKTVNMHDPRGKEQSQAVRRGSARHRTMMDMGWLEGGAYTPERAGAKQDEINRAMDLYGVDEQTANSIAEGYIRPIVDEVNGGVRLIDIARQREIPLLENRQGSGVNSGPLDAQEGQPQLAPQLRAPGTESLYELADNTGLVNGMYEAFSGLTGQFSDNFVAEDVIRARQTMRTAKNEMIRSLALNPRFPIGEIQRLEREINIEPSVFDAPASLRARMESIDASLRQRLDNENNAVNNSDLPAATRQAAASSAKDIQNFLTSLGVPEGAGTESQLPSVATESEYNALPSGAEYEDPDGNVRVKQ